jgi:hypothetical protein
VRVSASGGGGLSVSAFRNPDRSLAVQVLNPGTTPQRVHLHGRAYLVDATHDLAPYDGRVVPGRALVTYVTR